MMKSTSSSPPPAHLAKPKPEQFGLPCDFDVNGHIQEAQRRRGLSTNIIKVSSYALGFILAGYICYRAMDYGSMAEYFSHLGNYILTGWLGIFLAMAAELFIGDLYKRCVHNLTPIGIRSYLAALTDHEAAVKSWSERQLEAGAMFWYEKRGIALELALKDFLVRRGCKAQTTKATGDGGVDLKVWMGATTYWCQCKGLAAPVGVAVVREIAGACSRGGGQPVVIAVNGYTSSAVSTAKELGVVLVDTHNLIRLAKLNRISEWL